MKRKQLTTLILSDSDFVEMVHNTYLTPIKNSIRGVLNNKRAYIDASVDENDIYSDVQLALLTKGYAAKLQQPGTTATATLRSRLCAFARRAAMNHITKMKRRHDVIAVNPYARAGKYCEALTPQEMASMRADELELEEA
jgi:hypothetical protein